MTEKNIVERIDVKINELMKEQEELVREYNMYSSRMQEILTRLAQIQGAISELKNLKEEKTETSNITI